MNINDLKFDEKGLIPAVVQDYFSKQVLTVAYMNRESLEISIKEGRTCFFSRSRQHRGQQGVLLPGGFRQGNREIHPG